MTAGANVFSTDAELEMLRSAARGFLLQKWPAEHAVASSQAPEKLRQIWEECGRQGWLAIGSAAEGGGMQFAAVLLEELGRVSCPAPILDAFLGNLILSKLINRSSEVDGLIAKLHGGKAALSLVLGAYDGDANAGRIEASENGKNVSLSGRAAFIDGASIATHLVVITGRSAEIAIVSADAREVTITATPGLGVPPLAEVEFNTAPTTTGQCGMNDLQTVRRLARLGLAARALGAATRGFEMVVEYAKVRKQFGKQIGQYQAIQHKLANCLINIDISRLAIARAAASYDRGDADWIYAAGTAISIASPALRQVCLETHHAFGGVSFWEEHEMPRHFRRIHADLVRCGGVHGAREDVARILLDDAR